MRHAMLECTKSTEGSASKLSHRIWFFVVACALALAFSPAAHGQATGSFSGTVVDKSGSGVPGATVTATSEGTGLGRGTKTDNAGHYVIPLLPVSIYTIRIE